MVLGTWTADYCAGNRDSRGADFMYSQASLFFFVCVAVFVYGYRTAVHGTGDADWMVSGGKDRFALVSCGSDSLRGSGHCRYNDAFPQAAAERGAQAPALLSSVGNANAPLLAAGVARYT